MAIGDDFRIETGKDIRYTGTTANYTVLELHRWLQDRADDASSSGDDYMDITRDTPSDKSFDTIINLINGYNIDDTAAQHLYDGSIIQSGGDVIYDGIRVLAPAGMYLNIIQNGALATNFWTTGLNAVAADGISHQFLIKVRSGGADIDGRRLIGTTREWGKTFLEFKINGTSRGVNVMAFTGWATDLNNTTDIGDLTASPFTTVSLTTAGYNGIDVNGDTTDEYYYSEWNKGSATINQFYERIKYLTRRGETTTLYGLQGQLFRGITHEINVDGPTGTFSAFEAVSWSGGTGQMLAINSTTAATKMWIQLLTGVAPTDNQVITGGTSAATATVNVTVTERTVSAPICGISTGSAIIGAYGFGIEALDLGVNDKVFDLTNTQITPPNLVTFTVGGLVSGDSVLVAPYDAVTNIDLNQFTLNGTLSGAAVTSVVVNEAIPTDTPATGTIRIQRDNGAYTRHPYSAFDSGTKTFTITSHDFSSNNATTGNNTYISYLDVVTSSTSEAFQCNYASNRTLFVRIRDGGATPIKTFESTATLSSSGGSVSAIRTSDA